MNSHNPFNTGGDGGCTNDFRSADQLVDRIIGDAYHVVKEVYLALGNLTYIYNYLQKYGLIITVDSEEALKDIPLSIGKFARVYNKSEDFGYYFTDYLYVNDDQSGILPNEPDATGSWMSASSTGSNASFVKIWKYVAPEDGVTLINLPTNTPVVDVQTIYVQGVRQDVNDGFTYNKEHKSILLADELEEGNAVTVIIGITDPDLDIDILSVLSGIDGASGIGTKDGRTVQEYLDDLLEGQQYFSINTRSLWERLLLEYGYNLNAGSFQEGATVTSSGSALLDLATGSCYLWKGGLPYAVPPKSSPDSTGGISTSTWEKVTATLRSQLANSGGTNMIMHNDGNTVRTHLERFYKTFTGVIQAPTWATVQGSNAIKFSAGLFSFAGQPLVGQDKTVIVTGSTVCIVITSSGNYEARDRIPFDGSILVAHVRSGSVVEVVGDMNRSAYGFAGTPTSIPWLPVELRRIEEKIPINITVNSDGSLSYSTDYDVSVKKAGGLTYYVDCTNGSDTTGDGTIEKPFQRIKFAIEKTPFARTIMVKGGMTYTRDFTWNASVVDRDLDVIGYDGKPVLTTIEPNPVWTPQGSPGVYQYTGNLVLNVADYANIGAYGQPQVLTPVATLDECIAKAGSSYLTGSTLYIHLFDGRAPDTDAKLVMKITNGRIQDNCKVYLENLDFGASFRGFQAEVRDANKQGYLYAKNCNFGLTVTANSYNSLGVHTILQDCTGSFGMQDIANYHSDTLGLDKKPWFIEINCKFGNGGFDGLPNNNASTAHDGTVGIRIGGEYYATYGRVVHDVHDGTVTANFGCYSHDSSRSDYLGGACFTAGQGSDLTGKAKIYLYGCRHSGPNAAITKDGQSEVWLFDTPIGVNTQYNLVTPYKFVQ